MQCFLAPRDQVTKRFVRGPLEPLPRATLGGNLASWPLGFSPRSPSPRRRRGHRRPKAAQRWGGSLSRAGGGRRGASPSELTASSVAPPLRSDSFTQCPGDSSEHPLGGGCPLGCGFSAGGGSDLDPIGAEDDDGGGGGR